MLEKETTGLIVVDIQGKLANLVHNSHMLILNCTKLIQGAKILNLPIIWLEQNPDKLGHTVKELGVLLNPAIPITKFSFNACEEPNVIQSMNTIDVDSWLVCGIESHICVYQTVLGLQRLGYKVQVVSDCISSRTVENTQLGIQMLMNKGVDMTGVEMCLYELVKDCRLEEFKPILNLIK
ncbi:MULTISPECIES: isochorismatase family protein [Vibrio]|uniref:Isochorismatase family protein n=1 Tax=Vibrio casei TaxID=673372 RepID=A0A368LJJ7_9VIBR|nr:MULTISPECIES: isochorismatase family protein [Vibrio]RCS70877.1 isochorismatase family protein [Vibrio casei]SJN40380.1 Isochorismatase [Vibrio casei]HBV76662.1 hydrolase [Vibrio sp.]